MLPKFVISTSSVNPDYKQEPLHLYTVELENSHASSMKFFVEIDHDPEMPVAPECAQLPGFVKESLVHAAHPPVEFMDKPELQFIATAHVHEPAEHSNASVDHHNHAMVVGHEVQHGHHENQTDQGQHYHIHLAMAPHGHGKHGHAHEGEAHAEETEGSGHADHEGSGHADHEGSGHAEEVEGSGHEEAEAHEHEAHEHAPERVHAIDLGHGHPKIFLHLPHISSHGHDSHGHDSHGHGSHGHGEPGHEQEPAHEHAHEIAHGTGEVQDCGTVLMGSLGAHSVLQSKVMLSPCSCYVIRIHSAHVSV